MDDVYGKKMYQSSSRLCVLNTFKKEYILEEGERIIGVVCGNKKNDSSLRFDVQFVIGKLIAL